MTAPDAQHAGVPLRQISLNTFYIADSDPTWIALPLSEDAQKARRELVMDCLAGARFDKGAELSHGEIANAVLTALGIGGPA